MATLVLGAAGAAFGSSIGGSVLGLSAAVIGRAAGATLGQVFDQRLLGGGSDVVETGRIDRFRLTGASEGAALGRVYGRLRIGGQVIWSSRFRERRSTSEVGGKGAGGGQTVRSFSYSVSLAIALCEGEISHVGRIWADGAEVGRDRLTIRVYPGSEDQLPDPKIAAVEGSENTPAYRGTAYVVIEDLDLGPFGNRVPQFSFEVIRPDLEGEGVVSVTRGVEAVALIPGTGEYSLATSKVRYETGPGRVTSANVHTGSGKSDFATSLDALTAELPSCRAVSMVVSWFGDDLRCGECRLRPKIEQDKIDGTPMRWTVAGLDRASAGHVPRRDGDPVYGGTPADAAVVEGIRALQAADQDVMFYPFILMEQLPGNGRADPWTGADDQPDLPWRGRITLSAAPGRSGSPDGTAEADAQVRRFFGEARVEDFRVEDGRVVYSGSGDWGFRRFILHYAALCAAAGGVHSFCIGSEMRGLTQIRGASGFPAVAELRRLAEDVRAIVGPGTKIGYAADWSEYFGYNPSDGTGDHHFHLDPLWAHPEIDFIGIDNYMPLSDWRDGADHADAAWGSIYDLDYLKANVAGGEGYDWYYADEAGAAAQDRLPITDGAYGEPWVFRYKDLLNWWSNRHHDRIGGVRQSDPTGWVPKSKPIWFTELGCAAIDKGTNQPNKFLDPKSSESRLPRASDGSRDDLIQMQYLRAMFDYWADPANNPASDLYDGAMVDMTKAFVWAWDARPYPWFPGLTDVWNDGDNYARGHWLNGRTTSQSLASVVAGICRENGIVRPDTSRLWGLVRGYGIGDVQTGRADLQPLMLAYGFEAVEREGRLSFRNRGAELDAILAEGDLARHPEQSADVTKSRASDGETPKRVRLACLDSGGEYEGRVTETALPGAEDETATQTEMNLVLTAAEARGVTERWLAEGAVARETAKFCLPPSLMALGAGDVVGLTGAGGLTRWRIDRCDQLDRQLVEATRVEPDVYHGGSDVDDPPRLTTPLPSFPPAAVFLDLPLLSGEERPHAPHVAVVAEPWPGPMAVYHAPSDADYRPLTEVVLPASVGETRSVLAAATPGVLDRGPPLLIHMPGASLSSVSQEALLAGANAIAIGDGSADRWEVLQFQKAELVGPDLWELSIRLRGQAGTDALMPSSWPAGSSLVLLDAAVVQLPLASSLRGVSRHYRIGPVVDSYTDDSFLATNGAFDGVGLRPYAPVHLSATRLENGDDRITWIRRTRIDGDVWSGGDVPLGEAEETYLIRVYDGGALRLERDATRTSVTLTAAERAAAGLGATYRVEVAQVSDRFGPGLFRGIDIDANS